MKRQTSKPVRVIFADSRLYSAFQKLESSRFEYERKLHEKISEAIDEIKKNPFCGIEIPHKLISRQYFQKFGVDNLWKYNLTPEWRLIYTNIGSDLEIVSVVLEWFDDHKKYERKFKY